MVQSLSGKPSEEDSCKILLVEEYIGRRRADKATENITNKSLFMMI